VLTSTAKIAKAGEKKRKRQKRKKETKKNKQKGKKNKILRHRHFLPNINFMLPIPLVLKVIR
jgi:hypothetical protein